MRFYSIIFAKSEVTYPKFQKSINTLKYNALLKSKFYEISQNLASLYRLYKIWNFSGKYNGDTGNTIIEISNKMLICSYIRAFWHFARFKGAKISC
jgi:hypothetical protein